MRPLGSTGLHVFPLCLGGNVFGWTADGPTSHAILDAFVAAGGNFLDTADVYPKWAPGRTGGESEAIIGTWLASRGRRDEVVLATKVGQDNGLRPEVLRRDAEASLRRLQTDHVDILYAHFDDASTPLEESLGEFDALVREGKARHLAASNYSAARLAEALAVSDREGFARYEVLQPNFNLLARDDYDGELADLCARERIGVVPYRALANGFLTGKYRPGSEIDSPRAQEASEFLDARGAATLEALDEVAAEHACTVTEVALAWVAAQPTVTAPLASARNVEQLGTLVASTRIELSQADLERLEAAASPVA
jgi:aryl-alcohol dehydrogenase-like predicted oxidoreductase